VTGGFTALIGLLLREIAGKKKNLAVSETEMVRGMISYLPWNIILKILWQYY
jgi:hypothetical protein